MGVQLGQLLSKEKLQIADLQGKCIAFDAFNILFQFLSNIRSPDGALLTDHQGRVTSHLIGLFSRTARFIQEGIRPIFVFDGVPSHYKHEEIAKRKQVKAEAEKRYREAVELEDTAAMKKYAARTATLSNEMVQDAQKLLHLLGVSVVQAPSEGEAQAAQFTKTGIAYAVGSQDYDSLLYGARFLIQNLSIAGRRKKLRQLSTVVVTPEKIDLQKNLQDMGIHQNQLIALALLVGTDYNEGIKGIGPKRALKLVREYGSDWERLFEAVKWKEHCPHQWQNIFELFTHAPAQPTVDVTPPPFQEQALHNFLIMEHDFSHDRVEKTLTDLKSFKKSQTNLATFFT